MQRKNTSPANTSAFQKQPRKLVTSKTNEKTIIFEYDNIRIIKLQKKIFFLSKEPFENQVITNLSRIFLGIFSSVM